MRQALSLRAIHRLTKASKDYNTHKTTDYLAASSVMDVWDFKRKMHNRWLTFHCTVQQFLWAQNGTALCWPEINQFS
jgi:hypothetical protein